MTIAIFSDIHANLPALTAFFKDIDQRKPDAIYCLGDLVGYNVWPNEVIREIRHRGIATIAGNHDEKVKKISAGDTSGKNYAYSLIGEDERNYLRTLPAHLRITFQLNNDQLTLLLVHGSPRSIDEYLFEETNEADLKAILKAADADILCFGHTHKPYLRTVAINNDGHTQYAHAINTGSVGKPKDGDPRGSYILLHINENSSVQDKESVQAEIIRFTYDVEAAAKAVEDSPLPDEFADMLRKAY